MDRPTDWLAYLLIYLYLQYLLTYLPTYLLTYLLIHSDKHNWTMAWVTYLISSLINIALSRGVHFHHLQRLQCLHQGATFVLLCVPFFLHNHVQVMISGRHIMAYTISYFDAMKQVLHCWNWGIMALTYRDIGHVSQVNLPYFLL